MFNETDIKQIVAVSVLLAATKCTKFVFGRGSAPDPAAGAHDASPDPLVSWEEDTPSPFPTRRLRRLDSHAFGVRLGAFGASLPAFRHFFFHSLSTGGRYGVDPCTDESRYRVRASSTPCSMS